MSRKSAKKTDEELTVVVLFIRKEKIRRGRESFDDFIQRLRKKYVKALKTDRVTIQVVERKGEHA